jgi:hypothetical protein
VATTRFLFFVGPTIEILDLEHACWKNRANFYQLVSTPFFEVKRGFVDRRKIVPLK